MNLGPNADAENDLGMFFAGLSGYSDHPALLGELLGDYVKSLGSGKLQRPDVRKGVWDILNKNGLSGEKGLAIGQPLIDFVMDLQ